MPGVLEGVKVLDMASMWATPLAGAYLADQGADVIKVEPPWGDLARRTFSSPPMANGESRSWLMAGRGKRGIAVDIACPEGREIIHRLVRNGDVLLTNFRVEVARRLGYDYETLCNLNPGLIYVRVSAYGDRGPYADQRGYDRIFQALSGMMRQSTSGAPPATAGVWAADMSGPWAVCYGVALALLHRERTGEGQVVETSLLEMALSMQAVDLIRVEREPVSEGLGEHYSSQALFIPYQCSDSRWINIVVISDKEFAGLCQALGEPHLSNDPKFATPLDRVKNSRTLYDLLSGLFSTRPLDQWLDTLKQHDVPCSSVLSRQEVFDSAQVEANQMMVCLEYPEIGKTEMVNVPVRLSDRPGRVQRRAPLLGEHTEEVLKELGYTAEEIALLFQKGPVR
ncbi:MAG: CaiB/BaiF CoA transferase family protein [Dehalococcoidia bacterium]